MLYYYYPDSGRNLTFPCCCDHAEEPEGGITLKLLSIAIPCYNSAAYMRRCIDSLLGGGEQVEILIVDDGSTKDNTLQIANEYEARYPGICRAIHQENGGHGEAVNTGLKNASGVYFKVVDSDDQVDAEAYQKILSLLSAFQEKGSSLDMLISNFVYDKEGEKNKKAIRYRTAMPRGEVFGWEDIGYFGLGHYILMHSVIYRTQLLKDCGLSLPRHTFYVDNIFVYYPLPYVKTMYYLDVDFYRYYIGREDQSVNEQVMIGRIEQQFTITRLMIDYYNLDQIPEPKLRNYMARYLEIMMTISSILAILSGERENMKKKRDLWLYLKKKDEALYRRFRRRFLGWGVNLPGKGGRFVAVTGYRIAQKMFKFN